METTDAASEPSYSRLGNRGQSESVGVVLLTAAVVVAVGVSGALVLGHPDVVGTDATPLLGAQVTSDSSKFHVTHGGGDTVLVTDLAVVVRGDGASNRYAVGRENLSGDGDDSFEPSETWSHAHGLSGGTAELLVVHVPSNELIAREYADVPPSPENEAPSASFRSSASDPGTRSAVEFDASTSVDDDGVVEYRWDWDADGATDETTTVPRTEHVFPGNDDYTVTLTVVDADGATDSVTRTMTVGAPVELADVTLADDGDGLVAPGDEVTVSATLAEFGRGVDSMTADAEGFDAATVTLSDSDDDGTYEGSFVLGRSPDEGDQSVVITATDDVGNTDSATAGPLTVDATAPNIETFEVTDRSRGGFYWIYWEYVESFGIEWSVTDERLTETTVAISRSGSVQESYSGASGDETYENTRVYGSDGRDHTITIVAVDAADNRACRFVTDTADETDPARPAYESC